MEPKYNRVLLLSDVHLCHINWYGMTSEERLSIMVKELNREYAKNPYDLILFVGDYALDFWVCSIGGSYLRDQHESNTANIIQNFFSKLPAPYFMLPGNHEQYAPQTWKAITGFDRYYAVPYGPYVFIMLDNFSGNLGPDVNSDGTYEPTNVEFVKSVMAENPGKKFFLLAHDFYVGQETDEFKELMKNPDILCLFSGHTHESRIFNLGHAFSNKCIVRTGNFSYSGGCDKDVATWGWRELCLHDDQQYVTTEYILPQTTYVIKGETKSHEAFRRDGMVINY